jgi:hypothetical protein
MALSAIMAVPAGDWTDTDAIGEYQYGTAHQLVGLVGDESPLSRCVRYRDGWSSAMGLCELLGVGRARLVRVARPAGVLFRPRVVTPSPLAPPLCVQVQPGPVPAPVHAGQGRGHAGSTAKGEPLRGAAFWCSARGGCRWWGWGLAPPPRDAQGSHGWCCPPSSGLSGCLGCLLAASRGCVGRSAGRAGYRRAGRHATF